ncbi:uncharacterized protein BO95DRAFT_91013 [Aspergillus brunneoviolaceus CBS 621.78]|uniref:Uncharacterized protein n=1 Tax=Aspergillus brunneoviolaceus CBS 621.78 TaxID=1450534 RepID=A0ACD1GCX3_9EURO|nr:hypothetical protein BO95DRAFT_91013 [Aspergillus brunneoviolaceus CBS 621.78]RAH47108.1 hypothetical protein BO95DRAFT_91013 [Aspergillus brunneoviolaceus CBS 621.78]
MGGSASCSFQMLVRGEGCGYGWIFLFLCALSRVIAREFQPSLHLLLRGGYRGLNVPSLGRLTVWANLEIMIEGAGVVGLGIDKTTMPSNNSIGHRAE